jgi:type IV pilus assembly protein PilA
MKKNSGFSLIELLIALMIVAMVTTLATIVLTFGLQSFGTSTKQISQQAKVLEVTGRIRKDIEEAASCGYKNSAGGSAIELKYPEPEVPDRVWIFKNSGLYLKIGTAMEVLVVGGLDTNLLNNGDYDTRVTRFQKINNSIYLSIKPVKTNTTLHQNRNINNLVITEFSVKYKSCYSIP